MVFVQLPVTPGLDSLSEGQVFAMAPQPDWPAPQADNVRTAAVDVVLRRRPAPLDGAAVRRRQRARPASRRRRCRRSTWRWCSTGRVRCTAIRSGTWCSRPKRSSASSATVTGSRSWRSRTAFTWPFRRWSSTRTRETCRSARSASLADGGGTNFSGGLLAGLAQVFGAFQPWQINQVILFSDGQPNIGITDTRELTRIANERRRPRRRRHDHRLRHGARRASDAGDRRRVRRQLLLRRQPGRHGEHLPAGGGRDLAKRGARRRTSR